ncbi:MAG: hypothetical protein K6G62_07435 [Eubacterium sp.]|nr:hypothetical protein [Eubacterium sp.]
MNRTKFLYSYELRRCWGFVLGGFLMCSIAMIYLTLYMEVNSNGVRAMPNIVDIIWESESWEDMEIGSVFSEGLIALLTMGMVVVTGFFLPMVSILFSDMTNIKTDAFVRSLPFSQKERYRVKMNLGYGVITLTAGLLTAFAFLVRQTYIEKIYQGDLLHPAYEVLIANETPWHVLRIMLVFWLTMMAVFTVYTAVYSMVNQKVLAGLMGLGTLLGLRVIFHGIVEIRGTDGIDGLWYRLATILQGGQLCGGTSYFDRVEYVYYDNILYALIILPAIIVIGYLVGYFLQSGRDLSRQSCLLPNLPLRIVMSLGMGICFGLLLKELLCYFLMVEYMNENQSIQWGIWIISSLVLSGIFFRLLSIRRYYNVMA